MLNVFFFTASFLIHFSSAYADPSDCAKIVTNGVEHCNQLSVSFDLSACGDDRPLLVKKVHCKSDSDSVSVSASRNKIRYTAKLKSTRWGAYSNWALEGKITQSSGTPLPAPPSPISPPETIPSSPTPTPSLKKISLDAEKPPISTPTPFPLSISGTAMLRMEGDDYTDFSSTRDFFLLRIRPQFRYAADPQVALVFEPQFAKNLGERAYAVNPTNNLNVLNQRTSSASYDSAVGFHEGYLDYQPLDSLNFILGRQILSYGEELVIGASNWGLIGRSFDALKAHYSYSFGSTDLFFSKLADTDVTASGIGDADFYGLYNSWDLGSGLRAVDLYALYTNDSTAGPNSSIEAGGIRLKSDLKGTSLPEAIDYRLEATKEFGNAVSYGDDAYQVDAELGYTLLSQSKTRLMVERAQAGQRYDQWFPSPHRWLGYADIFGRRNIIDWGARASTDLGDKLSASVDFHRFFRSSSSSPLYKTSGAAFSGTTSSSSLDVGMEWDILLKYKLTKSLSLSADASFIKVGDYLKSLYNMKPSYYYVMLEAKF